MSRYEELKYVLSGATDWGYEYAKKEDVKAAFAELEERHAMELDQWVLELGKMKLENERLKKLLFNAQKAASDAKLSAHEKSRRIDELKAENESLKYSVATLDTDIAMMKRWRKFSDEMPEDEGDYLVMARYPDDDEPHIEICFYDRDGEDFGHYERRYAGSGDYFGGFDGEEWVSHNVAFWMPLPKAPKEA